MKNFLKMIVAIIVATAVAMVMIANGMNGKAVVCVYFGVGIMMSAILGVFGSADKQARVKGRVRSTFGRLLPQGRKNGEKFATARRGYRRAA